MSKYPQNISKIITGLRTRIYLGVRVTTATYNMETGAPDIPIAEEILSDRKEISLLVWIDIISTI